MSKRVPDTSGLLYDPRYEHDSCGVGFVADASGHRSHAILEKGLLAVTNVTHRGAVSADAKTGDGAGVMSQIPFKLFQREVEAMGQRVERPGDLAVGMIFLPGQDPEARAEAIASIEEAVESCGLHRFGWRQVPVDRSALGMTASATEPDIRQIVLGRPQGMDAAAFTKALYLARREIERRARKDELDDLYVASFSSKTVVYKGMLVAPQLSVYYQDLRDPDFETAIALFHQRYSTNTFPNWFLAQPFRTLAHNGEINTLWGNYNWMRAREPELRSDFWGDDVRKLIPIIDETGSDSAQLDNVAELLSVSGRDVLHTMMMLVPEPWESMPHMQPGLKVFYQYHACLTEPWDGPAALAFTDGDIVGACLDRNGLRPARYQITDDDVVIMGSEVGIVETDQSKVVEKGRLGPGNMIAVDTARGEVLTNDQIKNRVCNRKQYGKWVHRRLFQLGGVPKHSTDGHYTHLGLFQRQRAFNYTLEDLNFVIKAMILEAKEPVFSMGDDTALSVLARKPRLLYSFFKQRFAQVTNPPIDPLREELVMSLDTYLGARRSLLEETPDHAHLVRIETPILLNGDLEALRGLRDPGFRSRTLEAVFDLSDGPGALEAALDRLNAEAEQAIDEGCSILVVSDRNVSEERAPVPMLLAVGGLHQHLIRQGKRMRVSIVAESAEPREVHHFACLLGYGAAAVNPYLGLETLAELIEAGEIIDMTHEEATRNYRKALDGGILKIMSKMGISTVSSYHGAQIFEAIGIASGLIDRCFTGTTSWIEGIGLEEIAADVVERHRQAFAPSDVHKLDDVGYYRFRRDGEHHVNNPQMVRSFHAAVKSGSYEDYQVFRDIVEDRPATNIRDLLRFRETAPIPLDEVEPIEDICKRFNTAAMSLGALSPEAHATLARAMNMIGGKSDTGEGGDEPSRYWHSVDDDGYDAFSTIKQVASGRFGVTTEYLASAGELEIKMAQGSKPGEGGQLPGHKVVEHIARLRHAVPGIPLISPPPHHDIYSIEDLAQLIYDLKQVNPTARVCVKLVAEAGVGTIAAGVAKGYADTILISGDSGGTGASPLSSIKNAGSPWELGLAEAQQVLMFNDLRGRVTLRTDGGLKTGRDLVIAAILGADEFNFGTAALIAIGCKMARQCHLNTCPVGVATQKEELRQKFFGTPEMAVHYFTHVATETREILAQLGARSIGDIIGRTEYLEPIESEDPRARLLEVRRVLADPDPSNTKPRKCVEPRNDRPGDEPLDRAILLEIGEALEQKRHVTCELEVRNVNRSVGTMVSGRIAKLYRTSVLDEELAELRFTGSAGQSFGAFCAGGLRLFLEGEANDYVGKGMAGGEIVLRPPSNAKFLPHENIIMGNTVLYGATGGRLFAAGRAGERFAVRNSGATAVIEGAGDHCCEYMTAGLVVVLGETGRNFGAGMSNGLAFVLDEAGEFAERYNTEMIEIRRLSWHSDDDLLLGLIREHIELTGSAKGTEILENWDQYKPQFWKVVPKGYQEKAEAPSADAEPAPVGAR